jgi:hypothetical protein
VRFKINLNVIDGCTAVTVRNHKMNEYFISNIGVDLIELEPLAEIAGSSGFSVS